MKLIIADFDGTLADTFQPSPNGIGVTEAYETSILNIFGKKGVSIYQQIGGLNNRAPSEVITDLLASAGESYEEMITNAKSFHKRQNGTLAGLVPYGKGAGLNWINGRTNVVLSEMLVLRKLQILSNEIGCNWPKPFKGVVSFLNQCNQRSIKFALLTSGHELFIEKVFQHWGVEKPIMVTDDDLRGNTPYLSKPNAALMDLVLKKVPEGIPAIYLGDDPVKDGGFAENTGIPFGWFNPSKKKFDGILPENTLQFQSWDDLHKYI